MLLTAQSDDGMVVPFGRCEVQRGHVTLGTEVGVGPGFQEGEDNIRVAVLGSGEQGREVMLALCVQGGAC